MTEFSPSPEREPLAPSAAVDKYAVEAGQAYLLSQPMEGTIYEVGGPPDESDFRRTLNTMWEQRGITDPQQIDADYTEIMKRIETEGAEEFVLRAKAVRAAARAAINQRR